MNIDRIARAMVDVEPSIDLEARIRARVRAVPPAHTTARWSWYVAVPLMAAAVITLALVVRGPESKVQGPETRVAVHVSQGIPAEVAPALPFPKISTSRLAKAPASQLSSEEVAWMERRLPALDPVNALQMDHLRVDSIQPQPLGITPLTMTPVATDGGGIERRNDR